MNRSYRTPKGTELPLLNLKGKEYLEVKYRIVWFREERPLWRMQTEIVFHDKDSSVVCARIYDEQGNIMAMAHKTENLKGFPDHLEKCETGSLGRALALVGYGTQFCADELDEGSRLADAPNTPKAPVANRPGPTPQPTPPKASGPVITNKPAASELRGPSGTHGRNGIPEESRPSRPATNVHQIKPPSKPGPNVAPHKAPNTTVGMGSPGPLAPNAVATRDTLMELYKVGSGNGLNNAEMTALLMRNAGHDKWDELTNFQVGIIERSFLTTAKAKKERAEQK